MTIPNHDKNCLSYWFVKIEAAGLPVPKTRIVRAEMDLMPLLDGKEPEGFQDFMEDLWAALAEIGYPAFLRTGHTSAKHEWRDTCYVTSSSQLPTHVCNLVEWSNIESMMGLPTDVWAVREMLPTKPLFTAFNGMPICREFRLFVDGPQVVCRHAYWPRGSLIKGFPLKPRRHIAGQWWNISEKDYQLPKNFDQLYESLCLFSEDDHFKLHQLASLAGKTLGGQWSVDLIETERGWFVTDLALAHDSFHCEGCEHAERFTQTQA